MMKCDVYMVSLGCPKNQVDAEVMLHGLHEAGHRLVMAPEDADVIIVNTCGFITDAKVEAVDAVLEMAQYKQEGKLQKLIVTGCLSQRYPGEIAEELPEVDCVLGVTQYPRIAGYLDRVMAGEKITDTALDLSVIGCERRILTTPPYMAYLKIAEGCDNRCSYCAIPIIRGSYRSRLPEELANEARLLASRGVRELIVTAQDTTRYGMDRTGKPGLPELLRSLCAVDGLEWIRVLYTYPELVDEELMDLIAGEPKLCRYLDIPLQHVSDAILRAMNRRNTRADIDRIYDGIRGRSASIALRTTFIVGFPGETEQDFEELLSFVREHPLDHMGAFLYSAEEGTAAEGMPGQVPDDVKQHRLDRLMAAQQQVLRQWNARHIGKTYRVLVEEETGDGDYQGRTEYQAPGIDSAVRIKSRELLLPGQFVPVTIEAVEEYDWIGVCNP